MDDPGIGSSSTTVGARKRRSYTPMVWAKIRASLKYYYIDLDMTLKDAMQQVEEKHDFHATEQMYKKRLKTWGLSKQVKSDDKERALENILHNEPIASDHALIRHDKLVRYAKSRVRSGALDSHHLKRITKRLTAVAEFRHAATELPLPRSPALPDQFAKFDVFLLSMQALIRRERGEWLIGQQTQRTSSDAIFGALTRGMSLWRGNAFAAARASFGLAARETMKDLQRVSVSRITYCISSILWGSEREPVFRKFVEYMVKAAFEVLGHGSPLTIVLEYVVQHDPNVEAQVRIWECALDDYEISEQNFEHWWNMAQRRWRWCWRSRRFDLAAQYCSLAMSEARRIGRLTAELEMEAQRELDAIVLGEFT